MVTLAIELPPRTGQTAFNLERWTELLSDAELARFEGRVETDRHGNIVMSPPAAPLHARYQSRIMALLQSLLPHGEALPDCPVSTADGVKAPDVVWASAESLRASANRSCFPAAPEICVEVLSPRNTSAEMREKRNLYLNAGAKEVWICDQSGRMSFYDASANKMKFSVICPKFPLHMKLQHLRSLA
jgi:Uma2 family endonuclease